MDASTELKEVFDEPTRTLAMVARFAIFVDRAMARWKQFVNPPSHRDGLQLKRPWCLFVPAAPWVAAATEGGSIGG
jgi:hypothetical protein